MSVQLICCSHSPLMTTDVEESEANVHAEFFRELDSCAAALRAFNPDLVVCSGGSLQRLLLRADAGVLHRHRGRGTALGWKAGAAGVPASSRSCIRYLQSRDFDVAISHQMKVDHGITIPLFKLTGALARYDVLPIFVNCAADPRPSFRRVRASAKRSASSSPIRTCASRWSAPAASRTTRRRRGSTPAAEVARRLIVRHADPGGI